MAFVPPGPERISEHPRWQRNRGARGHGYVYRVRGKASECVWGCVADRYQWANLTGDYENPWDYAQMCISCHIRFDRSVAATMGINHTYPRIPR